MDPLASTADLAAVGVSTTNMPLADEMLRRASDAVRSAAGHPISQVTSTIAYDGWLCEKYLRLQAPPVTAVSAVTIDGDAVTDWRLTADGRLWRASGWGVDDGPAAVEVTQTHGLPVVPKHIIDLVCMYAAAGMTAAEASDYQARNGVISEEHPEYSVTYADDAVATVMEIPERTRTWLASLFGGSAAMVTTRS